jgi:K+-transporting ATPase KdpF subunit
MIIKHRSILLCTLAFSLAIAPAVVAATGSPLSPTQSTAVILLGLATIALSIYLFLVMFNPEKFS